VDRVEAYSVVPDNAPAAIWDPPPDVITFASPSAATNFVDRVDPKQLDRLKADCVFAAIGPATGARMTELGLPIQILAEDHTVSGFVEAIVQYYTKQREKECKWSS
jgi:uroporphyrinogen-III synthase